MFGVGCCCTLLLFSLHLIFFSLFVFVFILNNVALLVFVLLHFSVKRCPIYTCECESESVFVCLYSTMDVICCKQQWFIYCIVKEKLMSVAIIGLANIA